MIVLGIIFLLLANLVPWPLGMLFLASLLSVLGWILLIVGVVLLVIGLVTSRPVGGRRYWY